MAGTTLFPLGRFVLFSTLLLVLVSSPSSADPSAIHVAPIYNEEFESSAGPRARPAPYTTKTVLGFLDFITTVGNTVMVFTPKGGAEVSVAPKLTRSFNNLDIEPTVGIELESLFKSLDRNRDPAPFIEIQSSRRDQPDIRPTSVSDSGSSRVEEAVEEAVYDRFSTEPVNVVEETFRVKSSAVADDGQFETIRDNFFGESADGVYPTGVVTSTADTLIANGVTTVQSTAVLGTFLDGRYAQVVSSTVRVFQEEEEHAADSFAGSAQISELPKFAIETEEKDVDPIKAKIKNRFRGGRPRDSAIAAFKERLKNRYEKFRDTQETSSSNRRSFRPSKPKLPRTSSVRNIDAAGAKGDVFFITGVADIQPSTTSFQASRISNRFRERARGRSLEDEDFRSRGRSLDVDDFEEQPRSSEKSGRANGGFGSRHRSRVSTSSRPRFGSRNKPESSFGRTKGRDSAGNRFRGSSKRFQPDRVISRTQTVTPSSVRFVKPSLQSKRLTTVVSTSIPPSSVQIKKFNRFTRPNIRKKLLNKFLKKRPESENNVNPLDAAAAADNDLSFSDHDTSPSALVPSIVDDEEALQHLDDETRLERLQTTLLVSTVYPTESPDAYLEVATIRSPYTFDIEDNQKSTRFITVTRTVSKTSAEILPTPSSSLSIVRPTADSSAPSPQSTPLFQTESIPPPENILAPSSTAAYKEIILGSSDVETLPPVTIADYTIGATPTLKTVTETFSTAEVMIKKSILPIVIGSETSQYTLSQTYTVTRYVTALKTIPPMELYEFSPSKAFTDFDQLFEGAGSEKRYEQFLPGELEFSDQDDFEREGPTPVRVAPPPGFNDDLDLIGAKLDFMDNMEKDNNPGIVKLKTHSSPNIESSFSQPNHDHLNNFNQISPTKTQAANPFLADNNLQQQVGLLGGLGLTPEQLLYLQILQNPLAILGGGLGGLGQPKVVTETKPIFRTETAYETQTLKLFRGAEAFLTTLTNPVGLTTITDYEYHTRTVSPGLGALPSPVTHNRKVIDTSPVTPFGGGVGGIKPSLTVVTSTVTHNTVVPSVFMESYRIRFRNEFIYTTITSTTMVSTQLTSYVTKTQKVAPTVNHLLAAALAGALN